MSPRLRDEAGRCYKATVVGVKKIEKLNNRG